MDIFQAFILAFVQGVTEFLPVSSSGHLILLPKILGWQDQGLAFDVAVHVGTLLAVLIYFWHDVRLIISESLQHLFGGQETEHSRLGGHVIIATIPVGVVGLFLGDVIESNLRSPQFIAMAMILFAPLLWWVDKNNRQIKALSDLTLILAIFIGCAQAIALLPGVSRSGMTIIAALLLGLNRDSAARFSFLMAIPVIMLAGGLKAFTLLQTEVLVQWDMLMIGAAVSFVVALACIHWFLSYIRQFSMLPFSIYLVLLGLFVLALYH